MDLEWRSGLVEMDFLALAQSRRTKDVKNPVIEKETSPVLGCVAVKVSNCN